jgi:hypothetical protein
MELCPMCKEVARAVRRSSGEARWTVERIEGRDIWRLAPRREARQTTRYALQTNIGLAVYLISSGIHILQGLLAQRDEQTLEDDAVDELVGGSKLCWGQGKRRIGRIVHKTYLNLASQTCRSNGFRRSRNWFSSKSLAVSVSSGWKSSAVFQSTKRKRKTRFDDV